MLFSPDHVAVIVWGMDFASMVLLHHPSINIVVLLVDLDVPATTVAGR